MTAAFAYMQVVALSRLGEPESRTVFYFAVALLWRGRGHGFHWHVGLAGLARPVVAAHRRSGGGRAAVHDARLLHSQNLARHAGGGQFAVLRALCSPAIYSVVLFNDQIPRLGGWAWC